MVLTTRKRSRAAIPQHDLGLLVGQARVNNFACQLRLPGHGSLEPGNRLPRAEPLPARG
jgi:hypothetical protein